MSVNYVKTQRKKRRVYELKYTTLGSHSEHSTALTLRLNDLHYDSHLTSVNFHRRI